MVCFRSSAGFITSHSFLCASTSSLYMSLIKSLHTQSRIVLFLWKMQALSKLHAQ
jgi:hypothetical protein